MTISGCDDDNLGLWRFEAVSFYLTAKLNRRVEASAPKRVMPIAGSAAGGNLLSALDDDAARPALVGRKLSASEVIALAVKRLTI